MSRPLRLLLLGAALTCGCADHSWIDPFRVLTSLCAGRWEASPLEMGPSPPSSALSTIEFVIERLAERDADGRWPIGPIAWGTVIIDHTPWPMTLEFDDTLNPYCRFAPGHPFRQSPDPAGFHFNLIVSDWPYLFDDRGGDELFIDWYDNASRHRNGLETDWCCYERAS
jgi:hypothetical protein